MKVTISKGNQKIGFIPNVSLPPVKTCAYKVECAGKCYAMKSYRFWPDVRKCYDKNLRIYLEDCNQYFNDIEAYLNKKQPKFFRWHVSGDIPDKQYLMQMIYLARRHPETKFLCFTKKYNLPFEEYGIPKNLQIVYSAWPNRALPENSEFPIAWCKDGKEDRIPNNAIECFGNCENCGICWDLNKLKKDVYFNIH